jgi:hypothetical protein
VSTCRVHGRCSKQAQIAYDLGVTPFARRRQLILLFSCIRCCHVSRALGLARELMLSSNAARHHQAVARNMRAGRYQGCVWMRPHAPISRALSPRSSVQFGCTAGMEPDWSSCTCVSRICLGQRPGQPLQLLLGAVQVQVLELGGLQWSVGCQSCTDVQHGSNLIHEPAPAPPPAKNTVQVGWACAPQLLPMRHRCQSPHWTAPTPPPGDFIYHCGDWRSVVTDMCNIHAGHAPHKMLAQASNTAPLETTVVSHLISLLPSSEAMRHEGKPACDQ